MQLSSLLPLNCSITNLKLFGNFTYDCLAYLSQALYTNSHLTVLTHTPTVKHLHDVKFSKEEAIVLLINALQHNAGLRNLKMHSKYLLIFPSIYYVSDVYDLQHLGHQLRRGPSGPKLKLKRAHSLQLFYGT